MRQMPIEGRRFGVVDSTWRKTMEAVLKDPNVLNFVTDSDNNLLKTLQESNKMLDLIGKNLNEYLETKRLAFPRFYFLSNDELLSILSQTKNATAVQPHLSKCFDAVHRLHFEDDQVISGMYSAEGEYVPFHQTVNPNEGAKKGNVEIWLRDVESVIFSVVKHCTRTAIGQYACTPREQWILAHPGQVFFFFSAFI
jgi:dynein heavy chain